jgi:hypothetical protein
MEKHNLRTSYKDYRNQTTEPVDIKIYISIVNGYMKFMMAKLFHRGEVMLPERLGSIDIIGHKPTVEIVDGKIKGLAPDWAKTKQLWESDEEAKVAKTLVYHFNEDTAGVRYRFRWSKNRVMVANKTLYSIRMSRDNKRALSALVKQGKEYLIK